MSNKYVNRNPYPIYVSDNRGGQVMFRPGEFSTNDWFTRFVGPRKLTAEPIVPTPVVPNKASTSMQNSVVAPPKPKVAPLNTPPLAAVSNKPTFKDEDTPEYICRNGVYSCRLCDAFRTGSSGAMRMHITEYHGRNINKPEAPKPEEEETTVRTTMPGPSKPLVEDDMKVTTKKPVADAAVVPEQGTAVSEPEPELKRSTPPPAPVQIPTLETSSQEGPSEKKAIHACTHPGCEKSFTTANGLRMHITRMHPESK